DVIAIIERIFERFVDAAIHIHLEAAQKLHRMAFGHAMLAGDAANGNEDRLVGAAFKRSLRFFPKLLKPLCRRFSASRLLCESEDLVVDDVIAVAAPRV